MSQSLWVPEVKCSFSRSVLLLLLRYPELRCRLRKGVAYRTAEISFCCIGLQPISHGLEAWFQGKTRRIEYRSTSLSYRYDGFKLCQGAFFK